ncbi:antibiotic biosynthesis monooxygenase [Nocardia uniformis]|uniref:Antibiotic biosynthesis monooxygenase n=1 Tax=Nocardia uniformis TaxID=53432 RepID=A0A849BPS7_9NOCA|nr:putative quinol monooxygenase [Nocardia uniformis]NNH68573.1 antibiotic biosynthesis monooxygenase [Nocardia uniformis]
MTQTIPESSNTPFALVGVARPKPEREAELRELLLSFVAPTRAEEGSLEYHFHEDNAEPGSFVFYEVWRSKEDLDRHLELPHMRDFWERRMEYLERDLDIKFLTMHSAYPRPVDA